MKVSLCMITKNEENNIERSISSCKDIADEVIVVDSESTDQTVKIAEELGAKVYTRPWTGDFAAARNYAIDKATGDWAIVLDADEYFGEGQGPKVREFISIADRQGFDFVLSPAHDIRKDSNEVFAKCYVERIFRRNAKIRYKNPIHEYLVNDDGSMKRAFSDSFIIYHTGYDPSLVKDKLERNLALLLSDISEESLMRHFYIAEIYSGLSNHEDVIKEADILISDGGFEDELKTGQKMFRIYVFKIKAMIALKERYAEAEIKKVADEATEKMPNHPEIRAVISDMHRHFGDIDEAIKSYEMAIALGKERRGGSFDDMFSGSFSDKFLHLANLYRIKGDVQGECQALLESLIEDNRNETALFELLTLTCELSFQDKTELIASIYDLDDVGDIGCLVKVSCLAGSNDIFMDLLLKLKEKQGLSLSDDMGIYCRLLFLQGEYDEMIDVASSWKGEEMSDRVLFEASLAKDCESGIMNTVDMTKFSSRDEQITFITEVVIDLLQTNREDLIRYLFMNPDIRRTIKMEGDSKDMIKKAFSKYRKDALYEDITVHDN